MDDELTDLAEQLGSTWQRKRKGEWTPAEWQAFERWERRELARDRSESVSIEIAATPDDDDGPPHYPRMTLRFDRESNGDGDAA